ncbi:MAG: PDZ domain-containing protein [Planctomycetes bacterium]|nr:PDZ domain-containing protein [Planctomycetota bacterium]
MRFSLWVAGLGLLALAPPAPAGEAKKDGPVDPTKQYQVPYRLTVPKHILIRAKINNKGPFNFILDTGAPALFVSTKVCKKLGIEPDRKGWGTFDRFEIEGGVVLEKAKGRVDDPFQLEGMNGLGLAGAELHGIIGYNVLAKFRMEIDFTRDKMTWTELAWEPKAPMGLGGRGGQGGLEVFGTIMKLVGGFLGRKAAPDVVPRGFLGVDVVDDDGVAVVKSVFPNGPADQGGLKAGDRILKFQDRSVYGLDGLQRFVQRVVAGEKIVLLVQRGDDKKKMEITIKVGEGL